MAWNSRLGWSGRRGTIGSRLTNPGRNGPSYRDRSTSVCRVSPYVPIAATRTVPYPSARSYGVSRPIAPCPTAYRYAASTSGTSSAMSRIPSPCFAWCCAYGVPARTEPASTNRAEPATRTYSAVSGYPCSGPR